MGTDRLVAYVDGFNLYYGLRDARLHSSRRLDLHGVCTSLLKSSQRLELVRYFTTRVRGDPAAVRRQSVYIDALLARGGLEIDFGHFLSSNTQCRSCGAVTRKREEKKTDVNIAVRLLEDAYSDRFDVAMVISGDSDLVPPVESVRNRFPDKRVLVAGPPERWSAQLSQAANAALRISPLTIRSNRLPDPVVTPSGTQLWAPRGWLPHWTATSNSGC
ncbi:MAG: NYN domain-containing protein [Acidimicrobiaceae bacterium]|nr:NYN domain-containing protein [Acidimicrobiaceae bacterium]